MKVSVGAWGGDEWSVGGDEWSVGLDCYSVWLACKPDSETVG